MKKVSVKNAMKKFIGMTAVALMLGSGMAFVSCSSDDEEEGTASVINPDNPSQPETPVNPNPSTVEFTAQKTTVSVENLGESAASAKSADESIATVEVTDGALSITSVKAGETTVTASKEGYGDAFVKVTVAADGSVTAEVSTKFKQRAADAVVTGIAVESNTNEFEFGAAEPDWKTILTVRKVYNDESTESVSEGFTVTGWDSSSAGEKELTVTFDGKTTTFKVTIKAPVVLASIKANAETIELDEDSSVEDLKAKLTVKAIMSDESEETVTDYEVSGFEGSKAGEQTVTLKYNEKTTTVAVKVMPWFKSLKFDDAFDGTNEKNYANESADYVSDDGTWIILHKVDKSAAKVSKNAAKSYNEDESYTSRIQMKLEVLKLKVGKNKEVILRVDGGSASGSGENRTLTAKGSTTATWKSFKGSADGKVCAGFLSVKGDANGYVTLSADNNINVYGIKVVESAEDLSAVVLGNSVKYENAKVTLSATEVNKDESITASASVDEVTTPLYANGLAGESSSKALTTFNFYVDPDGEGDEPVETLPTSEIGEHEIEAYLYTESTDEEGVPTKVENENVWAKATYTVLDPNVVRYTVTFNAGDGLFAEGVTTTFTVEENKTLDSNSIPKPTAPEGKRFLAWTSSVDGVTTESEITQNVTFTATYENRPSVSTYELDFSKLTSLAAGTKGTFTALNDSAVFFSDSLKAEGVKWTAKSSSIPSNFNNPTKGLSLSAGKMAVSSGKLQNAVKIVTTGAATLTAYVTVQTAGKSLTLDVYGSDNKSIKDTTGVTYTFDGETKTLGTAVESSVSTLTLHVITVTLPSEGTYYLGDTSDGKIQYGYLAVEM